MYYIFVQYSNKKHEGFMAREIPSDEAMQDKIITFNALDGAYIINMDKVDRIHITYRD